MVAAEAAAAQLLGGRAGTRAVAARAVTKGAVAKEVWTAERTVPAAKAAKLVRAVGPAQGSQRRGLR